MVGLEGGREEIESQQQMLKLASYSKVTLTIVHDFYSVSSSLGDLVSDHLV